MNCCRTLEFRRTCTALVALLKTKQKSYEMNKFLMLVWHAHRLHQYAPLYLSIPDQAATQRCTNFFPHTATFEWLL